MPRHKLLFLFVWLFVPFLGLTDEAESPADSLQKLLASARNAHSKAYYLNKIAGTYLRSDPEQAERYNTLALSEITDQKDTVYLQALYTKALIHADKQENDSVIYYQQYIIDNLHEHNNPLRADAYNERGLAYEAKGNYRDALISYIQALKIHEENRNVKGIINENLNMGLLYQYQRKYNLAENYFNKALHLSEQLQYKAGVAAAYNNMGINYQEQGKNQKALSCFIQVLSYDILSGDSIQIGDSYNNIGVVHLDLKEYEMAERYFLKSLTYKSRNKDFEGYANTCNNLAETYVYLNPAKALHWLDKAEQIATEKNFPTIMVETYRVYNLFYEYHHDYKPAYEYYKKYKELNDSIESDAMNIQIEQIQKQYEVEKKNKEIAQKNAEIEKQQLIEKVYRVLFVLALILGTYLAVLLIRNKKLTSQLQQHQAKIIQQNVELIRRNAETNKARDAAEEAAKAKSQFLSVMSHEIRTPLNAIVGVANLLDQSSPKEDQLENIKVLKLSTDHLMALINDILDLNKIDAGKMQMEEVEFDLHKLLHNIYDLYLLKAREKNINLILDKDAALPRYFIGDSLRLSQVLTNLVNNAIKFTTKGSVVMSVSVYDFTGSSRASILFSIKDTGIGIAPSNLDLVFESFMQAEFNTTRRYGGTGLGLSISKKILNMFGSDLKVKSEPDKGSEFYFIIDLEFITMHQNTHSPKEPTSDDLRKMEEKKILVAEDNPVNVFVLKQFLNKWGLIVDVVTNGLDAYNKCLSNHYDLILMDIHMPVMDGFEAAGRIRKINAKVPVIAITATRADDMQQRIREAGMNDYVTKPFQPDELIEKISGLL